MRFTIRHILLAIVVLAIGLAAWNAWLRDVVSIRDATPDDRVYDRYIGIDGDDAQVENILGISGIFKKRTRVHVSFYVVRSGTHELITAFSVGRSSNRIGESMLIRMNLLLALGERDIEGKIVTMLGCAGMTNGTGGIGWTEHQIDRSFTRTYNGQMTRGNELIVYATGDQEFDFNHQQSVDEFASANNGDYFLVVASLH